MKKFLLSLCTAALALSASAAQYTISFKKTSNGNDSGVPYSTVDPVSDLVEAESVPYLTSIEAVKFTYPGKDGLKVGKKAGEGNIKLGLAPEAQVKPTAISIEFSNNKYPNAGPSLKFNGVNFEATTKGDTYATVEVPTENLPELLEYLEFSSVFPDANTEGFIYVNSVTVTYDDEADAPATSEYTINFVVNGSDAMMPYFADELNKMVDETSLQYISEIETISGVRPGKSGVRVGRNSDVGNLKLALSPIAQVKPTAISVQFSSDTYPEASASLKFNGVEFAAESAFDEYTTVEFPSDQLPELLETLDFSDVLPAGVRSSIYLKSITVKYEEAAPASSDYTINFVVNGSDAMMPYFADELNKMVDETSLQYISEIETISGVRPGKSGVRVGRNSDVGNLKLALSPIAQVKPTAISVQFSSDTYPEASASLKFNGVEFAAESAFDEYTTVEFPSDQLPELLETLDFSDVLPAGVRSSIYLKSVTVKYGAAAAPAVAAPVFNLVENNGAYSLEITCEDADAKIYYTDDESAPTAESNLYTAPIELWGPATYKAIAVKDDATSKVTTYKADIPYLFEGFESFIDPEIGAQLNGQNVKVMGQMRAVYKAGSYTMVNCGYNNMLVYGSTPDLKNGDSFTSLSGKFELYNTLPELTSCQFGEITPATEASKVNPTPATIDMIAQTMLFQYVTVDDVEISNATSNTPTMSGVVDGTTVKVQMYNRFSLPYGTIQNGTGFSVTGFIGINRGTVQFWPTEISEGKAPEQVATPVITPESGEYEYGTEIKITCATEGATIHYTINGNKPTAESPMYKDGITLTKDITLSAIAVAKGMTDSEVATATFTLPVPKPTLPTPVLKLIETEYGFAVEMTCADEDATIYYNVDSDVDPSEDGDDSYPYDEPVDVYFPQTFKAIAILGAEFSEVATFTPEIPYTVLYGFDALFDPEMAEMLKDQEVKVMGEMTAIYQNGNYTYVRNEYNNMLVYGKDQPALKNGDTFSTLKGKFSPYNNQPQIKDAEYGEITPATEASKVNPQLIELGMIGQNMLCQYVTVNDVEISDINDKNAVLSAVVEGETTTAKLYNQFGLELKEGKGFTVTGFIGVFGKNIQFQPTEITGGVVMEQVAAPVFTPASGELKEGDLITITCETEGAKIYYTTNGDAPTAESTLYTAPIVFAEAMTVKAIALAEGMLDSDVVSASFTLRDPNLGEAQEATFDFTDIESLTPSFSESQANKDNAIEVAGVTFTSDNVSIEVTADADAGTQPRLFNSSSKTDPGWTLRIYTKNHAKVSVPDGYALQKIEMTGATLNNLVADNGTFADGVWTPDVNARAAAVTEVSFTSKTKNGAIKTLKVTYRSTSGVSDALVDADSDVEYYNLQGVRVQGQPAPGIYIRRQGATVSKVVIR
ncbi:MAG: chitobiase/beta-hexosaminidase C-terminal domain-containing protein [Muribaculaceae bacterium]|nr:chitobiase/beta-hexosaminidase C-terminal domain-containing protein [Muribaculaceae bacterium]